MPVHNTFKQTDRPDIRARWNYLETEHTNSGRIDRVVFPFIINALNN